MTHPKHGLAELREAGVVMPADVLLRFLAATGANPEWLRTGRGEPFVRGPSAAQASRRTPSSGRRHRTAAEAAMRYHAEQERHVPNSRPGESGSGW